MEVAPSKLRRSVIPFDWIVLYVGVVLCLGAFVIPRMPLYQCEARKAQAKNILREGLLKSSLTMHSADGAPRFRTQASKRYTVVGSNAEYGVELSTNFKGLQDPASLHICGRGNDYIFNRDVDCDSGLTSHRIECIPKGTQKNLTQLASESPRLEAQEKSLEITMSIQE